MNSFELNGVPIEAVDFFIFLGMEICLSKVKRRAGLVKTAMHGLSSVMKDNQISIKTKCRIVSALVFSIFTYGCKMWVLTANVQKESMR